MEIVELEAEKKINISKVEFSCDIIDKDIPKPLFQNYNSFIILSAPPRSGKSTWIINCLCKKNKVYNKRFDKIYICSPSMATAKEDPFSCIPPEQIEQELTVDFLYRFEDEVKGTGDRVLLILDDVVNDIRKNKGVDKMLAKILYNRRHITADGGDTANGVSVWLTTQSYNRIPLMLRKVANGLVAFKLKNVKEINSIFEEYIIGLNKEQFFQILKYIYKNNYDFMFLNMDNSYDKMFHRNFNQLVLKGV
tara:strand:- start:2022 stop:2771 length:750 start_codon:yes stop_codon:yes gene_type:complete